MNSTINMNKENKSLVKTVSSAKVATPSKQTKLATPANQTNSVKPTTTNSEKKVETVETVKPVKPVQISNEDQSEITNYINSLSKHETQTLEIAKSHLGSSFTIRKSIGFLEWKSKQKQE
jgi:hypothetical protein